MGLFKRLVRPKNENSRRFREEMAEKLDRRAIKYVTERLPNEDSDTVIGHAGMLLYREGEIQVIAGDGVLFRGKVTETHMSELMSLEGVILQGPDLTRGGEERTVIAYYTYYRKV